jgi:hypothetical protein
MNSPDWREKHILCREFQPEAGESDRRMLASYSHSYDRWRRHLSLTIDCPEPRRVLPPEQRVVIAVPGVGGLNHHYERLAA